MRGTVDVGQIVDNRGLADVFLQEHRDFIIALAARLRLPAIYANQTCVPNAGLMSYAVNYPDMGLSQCDNR